MKIFFNLPPFYQMSLMFDTGCVSVVDKQSLHKFLRMEASYLVEASVAHDMFQSCERKVKIVT